MHALAVLTAVLVLATAVTPAFGQAQPVGPTWTSDRVRAARSPGPEPTLAFDVRQETTEPGAPTKVETSRVVLASDFTYVVQGKTYRLDDFRLERTFIWSDGARTLVILDGHAEPAYRLMELANRKGLQAILAHLAATDSKVVPPANLEPYWREAELGVAEDADAPLTPRSTASGGEFLLGSDPVVRTEGRAADLAPSDRQPFTRYLALHLPLHPQVRHALAAAGALPARMEVETRLLNRKQTIALTFTGATHAQTAYPLPAGLQPDVEAQLGVSGTASAAGVRAAVDTIDGRFVGRQPTEDEIIAALRTGAAAGREMEVWLWFNAYLQQYGYRLKAPEGQAELKAIAPLVRSALQDPEVARFAAASNLSGNAPGAAGDRQEAARYLASQKALDALPFGTFRYVTFANLVAGARDTGKWDKAIFAAMPTPLVANYWTHIAAYPWSGNVYKDTGDSYLRSFDALKAWTAFNLGRAVDPEWRQGNLQSVARYEATLEANAPDFF